MEGLTLAIQGSGSEEMHLNSTGDPLARANRLPRGANQVKILRLPSRGELEISEHGNAYHSMKRKMTG